MMDALRDVNGLNFVVGTPPDLLCKLAVVSFVSFHVQHGIKKLQNNYFLRKSEVSVEKISVCNAIENLAEHGIHCLPCS